ncbi:hypothetical protein S1OALGB6SA_1654 [Olavius algarvensis spirochete endosymbiont]|nr:hypothetical protein S1OALGB6SA_1654 [Olavius algarvensis spirochete endosymbiont]
MRPEQLEQLLTILEIIDSKQVFQAVRAKQVALHIEGQITIIRQGMRGKPYPAKTG